MGRFGTAGAPSLRVGVCCTPGRQRAGEGGGESNKEVAAETVGKLGPVRVSGIDERGQSALQIPPHHFDGSAP